MKPLLLSFLFVFPLSAMQRKPDKDELLELNAPLTVKLAMISTMLSQQRVACPFVKEGNIRLGYTAGYVIGAYVVGKELLYSQYTQPKNK
jgi:hypothetical protein